jgi:hypothetical protein
VTREDLDSIGELLRDTYPPIGGGTPSEKITRVETLLIGLTASFHAHAFSTNARLDKISDELSADKKELAALKNKGAGILIGVSIVAGLVGAKISSFIVAFMGAMR